LFKIFKYPIFKFDGGNENATLAKTKFKTKNEVSLAIQQTFQFFFFNFEAFQNSINFLEQIFFIQFHF